MKGLADETANLNEVLKNIDSSSLKELGMAEATLKKQMQEAKPNTDEYKKAAQDLKLVQTRISDLNREQKEVNTSIDKYNEELKSCGKSAEKVKQETKLIDQTLSNLSTAKIREMEYTVQVLNERLRDTDRGTDAYKRLENQLKRVKAQLSAVAAEQQVATKGSIWSRFANSMNKNMVAVTSVMASITGLTMTVRNCVEAYTEMDQEMNNVRKYTGQTMQQVEDMNEDFKRMDTRTSREELNQLAGAAGRLGITSKQMIEEFVDASDKINVALGDDLGEGAVDKIGKLAQVFGEDKTKGLRGAMLATGSAVNELAQSSSANAGYIVDFTADLAGVARQANMSQAEIMGLGSALDQNMQEEATASTVFSQLITKMYQDPAKFAKLAGVDVKKFTTMLKTDANEALLTFMQTMQNKGGFSALAPMFQQMNLDGTRAVGVLSSVATHLDQVKEAQDVANKAYKAGTSVIGEFNVQNETEAAKIDKAKKAFKEITIELGQKLLPIARYGITTTSLLVKGLSLLTDFVIKYRGTLIRLAATIVIINTLMNLSNIAFKVQYAWITLCQKAEKAYTATVILLRSSLVALHAVWSLLTKGVQGYIVVMRAAKMASLTNPWTALATVVLSVGVAVYELIEHLKGESEEAEKAALATDKFYQIQKNTKEVNEQANKTVAEEVTQLNSLRHTLEDNNAKLDDRRKALERIKQMVPSYHGELTNEGKLIKSNVNVLEQYINNLVRAARAQAAFNKMVQIQESSLNHESLRNARKGNQEFYRQKMMSEYNYDPKRDRIMYLVGDGTYVLDSHGNKKSEALSGTDTARLNQYIAMYNWNQKRIEQEDKILDVNKAQTSELEKQVRVNGGVTPTTSTGGSTSTTGPTSSGYTPADMNAAKKAKAAAAAEKKREAAREKAFKAEIKAEKSNSAKIQAQLITEYSTGEKLYSDYMDARHKATIDGLEKILAVYVKYGKNTGEIEKQIAEERQAEEEDHQRNSIKDLERDKAKKQAEARLDYYNPSNEIYQNEDALNERLFLIDYNAQQEKVKMLTKGTEEWFDAQDELEQMQRDHQLDLQQRYEESLQNLRAQFGEADVEMQEKIALDGLDYIHKKGLISEEEYQQMLQNIKMYYAEQQSEQDLYNSKGEQFKRDTDSKYKTASNNAKADYENKHSEGEGVKDYLTYDVQIYAATMANIKQMEKENVMTHKQAMAAMGEATAEMCKGLVSKMQAAYEAISPIMDGMSSYYSAQSDYEVAVTEKKYDKLISAAGNNTAKTKNSKRKRKGNC